jgi:hypothetical protein
MRTVVLTVLLVLAATQSAPAQVVVIDPGNLVQAILIADRTVREYQAVRAKYETLVRMARGLRDLSGYRVPIIPIVSHDPARWEFGRPWLQGLNSGDAAGTAYLAVARRLQRPDATLAPLPAAARQAIERTYATIEISDSTAQMGGHQVALMRGYSGRLQTAIDALDRDVLSTATGYHEATAILDKIAGGQLVSRRADTAANQLLSHVLEQQLARAKRLRDAEAATMNMRFGGLRDGRIAGTALVRGAADDLRTWRQP